MTTQAGWICGARVIDPTAGVDGKRDVYFSGDHVSVHPTGTAPSQGVVDASGLWLVPGLIDLQVHFRQPGFEYKETVRSGAAAAFAGGFTGVVVMPNTRPALDTPERVRFQMEEGQRAGLQLWVAAAATQALEGRALTDHAALKAAGAIAITDDGLPLLDDELMAASLRECAVHDLLFMQHAEDTRVSAHAPMTECAVSASLGVRGQPADAEGVVVERDVALAEEMNARYHVLHTSTARSLDAIRRAKRRGARVTCEASPHHLLLNTDACRDGDPNSKMNPPLREERDRLALVEALCDGTIDAVATDHAPHSIEEKARGFVDAPFGVIGLETALAALLSFVHAGRISALRAIELLASGPARVLGLEGQAGTLGAPTVAPSFALIDPALEWTVSPTTFAGRSQNSAFLGRRFQGRVVATNSRGVWRYRHPQAPLGIIADAG